MNYALPKLLILQFGIATRISSKLLRKFLQFLVNLQIICAEFKTGKIEKIGVKSAFRTFAIVVTQISIKNHYKLEKIQKLLWLTFSGNLVCPEKFTSDNLFLEFEFTLYLFCFGYFLRWLYYTKLGNSVYIERIK